MQLWRAVSQGARKVHHFYAQLGCMIIMPGGHSLEGQDGRGGQVRRSKSKPHAAAAGGARWEGEGLYAGAQHDTAQRNFHPMHHVLPCFLPRDCSTPSSIGCSAVKSTKSSIMLLDDKPLCHIDNPVTVRWAAVCASGWFVYKRS